MNKILYFAAVFIVFAVVSANRQHRSFLFADGHDKGIYPWPYLQAIAANRAMELIN